MEALQSTAPAPTPPISSSPVPDARGESDGATPLTPFQAVLSKQIQNRNPASLPGIGTAEEIAAAMEAASGDTDTAAQVVDVTPPAEGAAIALPMLAMLPPQAAAAAVGTTPAERSGRISEQAAAGLQTAVTANSARATADQAGVAAAMPAVRAPSAEIGPVNQELLTGASRTHESSSARLGAEFQASGEAWARVTEGSHPRGGVAPDADRQALAQMAFSQILTEPAAPAPVPAAPLRLDTPFGNAGWNTELEQKVVWMVGAQQQVAELHVNPPDLGPIEIRLTIDDQQTTAVFTSPHSAVRDALESALPRLREVLADSGIMLGNASVTSDSPRDGAAYAQSQRYVPHTAAGLQGGLAAAQAPSVAVVARGIGLVDLFA